jgi:hypothetical protein
MKKITRENQNITRQMTKRRRRTLKVTKYTKKLHICSKQMENLGLFLSKMMTSQRFLLLVMLLACDAKKIVGIGLSY